MKYKSVHAGWLVLMIIICGALAAMLAFRGVSELTDQVSSNINGIDGIYGGGMKSELSTDDMQQEASGEAISIDNEAVFDTGRKFIRTADISMETLDFDVYRTKFDALIRDFGGYLESDETRTRDSLRHLTAIIRIPEDKLDDFLSKLPEGGTVLSQSMSQTDVTTQYTDYQAHIDALKTEQEWLQNAMMATESLEDMLSVRDRLTQVNYELDSIGRQFRQLENQINYATVDFYLAEIVRPSVKPDNIWERIGLGIAQNWDDVTGFFLNSFVWLVSHVFSVIILAEAAIAIIIIYCRKRRKKAAISESNHTDGGEA